MVGAAAPDDEIVQWPQGEEIWCDGNPEIFPEIKKLPFYHMVPRDRVANLKFRRDVIDRADHDEGYQRELNEACRADPLFWLAAFAWVYEPRPRPQILPMIPWKPQETLFWAMYKYLGMRDIGIYKSRGEGGSWVTLLLFLHQFIFGDVGGMGPAFGVASRNVDAVDRPNDPDALLWKVDFAIERLPRWMVPWWNSTTDRGRADHTFLNRETNATISGYSATQDLGTGGRKAQPLDARILTPSGWSTMGQIRVGDEVIGGNGRPTRVVGVYPQGEKEVFRVTFRDGASTECCDEHLWKVSTPYSRRHGKWFVRSLAEIREQGLRSGHNWEFRIPMNPFNLPRKAERFKEGEYPRAIVSIDPVGKKGCQCIKVENADGLYVTDDFIVTHNTSWLMDEMAKFLTVRDQYHAMNSTQHTTQCRIICSTPKGDIGAYYDCITKPSNMLKLVVHWTCNDRRRRGLYSADAKGNLRLLDKSYEYPPDYPFILDGKTRSPWYDLECQRPGATPASIAQELDLDFGGSTYKFFDNAVEQAKKTFQIPLAMGEVDFDPAALVARFVKLERGRLLLWRHLEKGGFFPAGDYVVGCDVASGTSGQYTSNSVLQIVDRSNGEQVAEWVSNSTLPQDFALMSVAICRWIEKSPGCTSFLIWDKLGGAGAQYTQAILEQTNYRNIYFSNPRREQIQITGKRRPSPGYAGKKPEEILGRLRDRIIRSELVVRSEGLVRELNEWEYRNGKLAHIPSISSDDESAKGQQHGDRVMAMAIALVGAVDRPLPQKPVDTRPKEPPYGSLAWRMQVWDQQERNEAADEFAWT